VEKVLSKGMNVVLDIEMQGVQQLQKLSGKVLSTKPLFIFIAPPSIDELEKRLRGRGTENEESLQKRLAASKKEMEWGMKAGNVDHVVHNNDVESAYKQLVSIILG
jgi:guanylate kinase